MTSAEKLTTTGYTAEERAHLVADPTAINALLRDLARRAVLLSAMTDTRKIGLASLLDVNPGSDAFTFEVSPGSAMVQDLLRAQTIGFLTTMDGARVKFWTHGPATPAPGRPQALRAALPPSVSRIQRREFFRLMPSLIPPLKVLIPLDPDDPGTVIETRVSDISCGGIAIVDERNRLDLQPGSRFTDCRIELPRTGIVTTGLEVCTIAGSRAGCRFVALSPPGAAMLQRFIMTANGKQRRQH